MDGRTSPHVPLVVPPLLNPWAPGLQTPLVAGALRSAGFAATAVDLNLRTVDWLLSEAGLAAVLDRVRRRAATGADERRIDRALAVVEPTVVRIAWARKVLRTRDGLADPERTRVARTVLRNACWIVSAAFDDLEFDLITNEGRYSPRSTRDVLAAAADPERNVYRWVLDRVLDPADLRGALAVGLDLSADTQLIGALTVARKIRELDPDLPVFAYGDFATRLTMRWREPHPFLDLIPDFLGHECELPAVRLVTGLAEGRDAEVPGRVRRVRDRLDRVPPEPADLNTLPFPAFDGLLLDRHLGPGPVFPTYASRGCPWKCEFCSIPVTKGRFRRRRAERVVAELRHLRDTYGARYLLFVDETMTVPSLRGVAGDLVRQGLDVFWFAETRFTGRLDEDLVRLLHRSGCRRLEFGLESYNQRVLDLMRKDTTLAQIDADVEACLRGGVSVHLFGIAGFPGETAEETCRTMDYIDGVLARARTTYGGAGSTSGLGAFQLDPYAPMAADLARFGIQALPPRSGEDLTLMTLDYTVSAGLGPDAVRDVLDASPAYRQTAVAADGPGFHAGRVKETREESFFRACHRLHAKDARRLPVRAWPSLHAETPVRRAEDTAVRVAPSGPSWVYRLATDAAVPLSASAARVLAELPERPAGYGDLLARLRAAGEPHADDLVRHCLRYGVLVAGAPATDPLTEPGWIARRDPYARETADRHLVSPVTGRGCRLDAAGRELWRLCAVGLPLGDLAGLDESASERVTALIRAYAEIGLLDFTPSPGTIDEAGDRSREPATRAS